MVSAIQPDTRISEAVPEQGKAAAVVATAAPKPYAIEGQPNKTFVESLERNVATQTATAAENTASANPLTFKPQLMHRDVTNDTGLRKLFQFPIDPLWNNYYTMLRAGGYTFNAAFPDLVKLAGNTFKKSSKEVIEPDIIFETGSIPAQKVAGPSQAKASDSGSPYVKKVMYLETAAFAGLALVYSYRDLRNLFENCKLALAAERGKEEQQVTMMDMFNTDNPIISTEANRVLWKGIIRVGSGAAYLHRLETGLLAAVLNISAERTIFYQKTSYDMASEIVNDVQLNHLTGDAVKEDIINGLQRIVQRTTVDHNRTPIGEAELRDLRPIFADMAEDIIEKRIGISSIIGYLGGGIIIPNNPNQSRVNYDYVKQHGLTHVAADGAQLREQLQIPDSQPIWPRYEPEIYQERADVAESAKRAKLLAERYGLDTRAAHLGSATVR